MKLTEKQLENAILEYLIGVLGIVCWKENSVGIYDQKTKRYRSQSKWEKINGSGKSDILGVLPDGRFLAIEVKKTGTKSIPKHQQAFLDRINENGGVAFWTQDIKTVKDRLGWLVGQGKTLP